MAKVDQDKFYSLTRNEIKNNKIPVGSVTSRYGHIIRLLNMITQL
ncbi:hypothetical protein NWE60_00395 [Mycoplasmopsis felis]|nr:hypothetical protein [Mycoplasmopsis felis]WAM01147.1 hypothetical protein NWE60_00395 [Mycoplasmopsis felis]